MKIKLDISSKLIPFIVIFLGTIFFFFYAPPPSICKDQIDSYKRSLRGKIYGYREQKNVIPPKIKKAVEYCREGKSNGSCIDYFELINQMSMNLNQIEEQCLGELFLEKDVLDIFKRFFLIASLLAWGDEVPKEAKTNWFSDANTLVFCKVKKNLEEHLPKEEYEELVTNIINSVPFTKLGLDSANDAEETKNNRAILKLDRNEVLNKSILSLRCERIL